MEVTWLSKPLKTDNLNGFIMSGYSRVHASEHIGLSDFDGRIMEFLSIIMEHKLAKTYGDLHNLTCAIEAMQSWSKTGDNYRAKKVVYAKIKVEVEEIELVDDIEVRTIDPTKTDKPKTNIIVEWLKA